MFDTTGVFPFSVLEDKYGITVDSVLRCDSSGANYIAGLLLAALAILLVMDVFAKLICAFLRRCSEEVTDKLLLELIDGAKNPLFFPILVKFFNDWCEKNSFENNPTIEDFVKRFDDGDFESRDEAVESYFKSKTRRDAWKELAIVSQGPDLARSMQHIVSGCFGLYALTITNDQDSFLTFARWGILFEAGWELTDSMKILYKVMTGGGFEFGDLFGLAHHGTLWLSYVLYTSLLPSEMGWDICLACFLYAGFVSIGAPFQFMKNFANIDLTETKGKVIYMILQSQSIFTVMLPRGPHWIYFACKLMRHLWNTGVSWPAFILSAVLVVGFSGVNAFLIFFMYKGFRSAIKKMRKSNEELKGEQKRGAALLRARRKSSMINVIAQEASVSSRRTNRRRSMTLMGLDYELDDDEVEEIEERMKGSKGGRRSSLFSFTDTTNTTKEE